MSGELIKLKGSNITVRPWYSMELPYDFIPSELKQLQEGTGDLDRLKFLNDRYQHFFYSARNGWGRDKNGKQLECIDYYERALKKRGIQERMGQTNPAKKNDSEYSRMTTKEKRSVLKQAIEVASQRSKLDPTIEFLKESQGFTNSLLTSPSAEDSNE